MESVAVVNWNPSTVATVKAMAVRIETWIQKCQIIIQNFCKICIIISIKMITKGTE